MLVVLGHMCVQVGESYKQTFIQGEFSVNYACFCERWLA